MTLKSFRKKIPIIIEKTKTGFSAYSPAYPVATTGSNVIEIQKNILEALNFYFEEEGYEVSDSNLQMQIDLQQFFRYYKVLNARHLAEKIEMNPTLLSQYVQGKKIPSPKQTERIFKGIRQIGRELSDLRLT